MEEWRPPRGVGAAETKAVEEGNAAGTPDGRADFIAGTAEQGNVTTVRRRRGTGSGLQVAETMAEDFIKLDVIDQ